MKILNGLRAMKAANEVRFAKAKIHPQTVQNVMGEGRRGYLPELKTIDEWCLACGTTAGAFLNGLEGRTEGAEHVPGYDDLYREIATVLRSSDPVRIEILAGVIRLACLPVPHVTEVDKKRKKPPQERHRDSA